ncbi:coiled-coil domain-containing protein 158 [Eublepharis macularius]|uniref:Coiled-coil domain-containing protein 158 n=1 Tax=Eublepharis macularius TaxID=481883 RepID=A0AA97L915_EUBMA|nr:coiled-coil domain-containing protein 158 [Eublepharis macularius]
MSKSIQELREALERQTKETLKLQEEATRFSVESVPCREGASSPSNMLSSNASGPFMDSPKPRSSSVRSTVLENLSCSSAPTSPTKTSYSKYEGDVGSSRRSSYFGKEHVENILEDYSQQVRELQKRLSDATELHEQQKLSLRQSVIELQASLQEAQKEKDSIVELRQKESQTSEEVCSELRATIKELETANQLQEKMLKEANNQVEHLKTMVQAHEDVLQDLRNILIDYERNSSKKVYEHESISSLHVRNLPTAFIKILRELDVEMMHVRGMIAPLEEQLEMMTKESQSKTELLLQQQQDSVERLISEHEMELEALSEKANASHSHASNIQSQLEIIQEQAKNQNSLYMRQISQLEGTVSQLRSELLETKRMSEDRIEDLEKQLFLAHSEMSEAQSERDQFSQETGDLDDQVQHLMAELRRKDTELSLEKEQNKRLWDRDTSSSIAIDRLQRELDSKNMELQRMDSIVTSMKSEHQGQVERQMSAIKEKNESLERLASVTAQQESTKEMLRKVVEELTEKKISLEAAERQVADLTACLQEKERVIESTNSEIQKLQGRVDSKLQELQQLKEEGDHLRNAQADCESFKLQLNEKNKVIEILRKQIDNMTQIVGQHGRTAGAMEMEKSQLLKEIGDKKLEVQELKLSHDKKDSRIRELEAGMSEMELEKVKLVNLSTERLRTMKELILERDQVVNEVKSSRLELAALSEESEFIKSDYRIKNEELETTVSKLKVQLKSAQIELEQTRATLKTMEGSDGHAMKVAMGMQKQITAKRGQIDALQSKIKFLEEAMTNATKEKHYLKEERNKLSQELSCVAALNNKMLGELEILRAQDKRMKDKLATMEAALDKASMQFAECQCIMQRQEQEVMRFKLQHTLDVKELQGPGYTLGSSSTKMRHSALPHSHPSSAPSSQAFAGHMTLLSSRVSSAKEDPLRDLKQLLQEVQSTIDEMPSASLPRRKSDSESDLLTDTTSNTRDLASRECIGKRLHDSYRRDAASRDSPSDVPVGSDTFSREPLLLHTADLEDSDTTLPFQSNVIHTIFTSTPRYTTSKKLSSEEKFKERSPVHTLLTAPLDDLKTISGTSSERRSSLKKSSSPEASISCRNTSFTASASTQAGEVSGNTCRKLQDKMESLQNLVETLQFKNQAMSSMIRSQEKKLEKAKEKEKKLSK